MKLSDAVRRNWLFLTLIVGPTALVLAGVSQIGAQTETSRPVGHVFVAGLVALAAILFAFLLLMSAHRTGGGAVVVLALGCFAVGMAMGGHGLLTPGVGSMVDNPWAERLPWLAVTIYAATLALGSEPNGAVVHWANRHRGLLAGVTLLATGGPLVVLTIDPLRFGSTRYQWESDAQTALTSIVVLLLMIAGWGQWRRWRLGGEVMLLALAMSAALTIAATISLRLSDRWELAWWDSDAYMLVGFAGVIAAALAPSRCHPRRPLALDRALADDPLVHISAGYPEALRALAREVEAKDPYTHGHSVRVAGLTVRLAVLLGLSADELRTLARGGLLHDVGKISIPREILNKASALDAFERAVIERHPRLGADLVGNSSELLDTIDVVLHHHERWDGSGYPDGLAGREIPLLARICAVADVWDALTTDRAYRRGWSPELALDHLSENAGILFDPDVVEAMVNHARRELGHVGSIPIAHRRVERVGAMHLL